MNFINLRNVANQEINESFSGILRISPNEKDGINLDDPSSLLYSIGEKIDLSDSAGNYLSISFIPQTHRTFVVGLEQTSYVNLINLTQKVSDLYCTTELHISPTLHIDLKKEDAMKAPIQIINNDGILLFPVEAPIDDRYINYNGKLGAKPIKNVLDDLVAEHEIYTSPEYESYHVKVNGKKIYRLKKASSALYPDSTEKEVNDAMVPELYMHDYVLGQSSGHTYRPKLDELSGEDENSRISILPEKVYEKFENDSTTRVTQLSFIEIEKLIWSLLEGSMSGAYRSFEGRYKGLYPVGMFADSQGTEDDLYNELFKPNDNTEIDEVALEDKIRANAPLVGLPIQSGLIMYNAMPARRFLFHTLRRYESLAVDNEHTPEVYPSIGRNLFVISPNTETEKERVAIRNSYISRSKADSASSFIHNLVTEYALCDGKRIKGRNEEYEDITDYPAINKNSANWSQYESPIYNAISSSMNLFGELRTPRLFELNQLSLRFLRGLNWQRIVEYDRIVTEGLEDKVSEKQYFDQTDMLIEQDGTFVMNDWFKPDSTERPEVVNGKLNYKFENNTAKYVLPGLPKDDPANIVKNFAEVGTYYANYDYHLASTYRHVHQVVVNKNLLKNGDRLDEVKGYYCGSESVFNETYKPVWDSYVKLEDGVANESFLGSYAMRSIQDVDITDKNLIRKIQDLPVTLQGGSSSALRKVRSSYKGARSHDPRCHGNYHKGENFYNADGGYRLAAYRSSGDKEGWRFLSSLPAGMNKYGSYKDANDLANASFNGTKVPIDDSLPNPPSISLIPLMKI